MASTIKGRALVCTRRRMLTGCASVGAFLGAASALAPLSCTTTVLLGTGGTGGGGTGPGGPGSTGSTGSTGGAGGTGNTGSTGSTGTLSSTGSGMKDAGEPDSILVDLDGQADSPFIPEGGDSDVS